MKYLLFSLLVFTTLQTNADVFSNDLYGRLGLQKDASASDIKKAYRSLARQYHPDLAKDNDKAKAQLAMAKLNEANEILSDATKRAQYDNSLIQEKTVLSGTPRSAEETEAIHNKAAQAQEELNEIYRQHPELGEFIGYVIQTDIAPHLKGHSQYYRHPKPIHIWPTDGELVKLILETKNQYLLRALAFSVLTLPSWENQPEILLKMIQQNHRKVNSFIAQFMYSNHWVNSAGAKILNILIDQGYHDQVTRSLGIAGGILKRSDKNQESIRGRAWYEIPEGQSLMKKLIAVSGGEVLKELDSVLERKGWSEVFQAIPEMKSLPYLSTNRMQPILKNQRRCLELFNPATHALMVN